MKLEPILDQAKEAPFIEFVNQHIWLISICIGLVAFIILYKQEWIKEWVNLTQKQYDWIVLLLLALLYLFLVLIGR
jgi:hypothetical protein